MWREQAGVNMEFNAHLDHRLSLLPPASDPPSPSDIKRREDCLTRFYADWQAANRVKQAKWVKEWWREIWAGLKMQARIHLARIWWKRLRKLWMWLEDVGENDPCTKEESVWVNAAGDLEISVALRVLQALLSIQNPLDVRSKAIPNGDTAEAMYGLCAVEGSFVHGGTKLRYFPHPTRPFKAVLLRLPDSHSHIVYSLAYVNISPDFSRWHYDPCVEMEIRHFNPKV